MKMQQQTISLDFRGVLFWMIAGVAAVILATGFGYFWGRYEQIQINRSLLKPIPEVNCF